MALAILSHDRVLASSTGSSTPPGRSSPAIPTAFSATPIARESRPTSRPARRRAWRQAAGLEKASLAEIENDPKLLELALAHGKAAFGDNCAPCHGSGGQGQKGYPNLTAGRWLWGGTLEQIQTTITHGIRFASDSDTHASAMPAFGKDGILKAGANPPGRELRAHARQA